MREIKGQTIRARGQGPGAGGLQSPRHRGVTLIELLVVVAIIVLLVGLFTLSTWYVSQSMNARQTRITMQQAMLALAEYTATTQRHIPFDGTAAYDRESIEDFTREILKVPSAREVLMSIDKVGHASDSPPSRAKLIDTTNPGNGEPNYIRDAWQTPLQYRSWHDGSDAYTGPGGGPLPARGSATHAQPFFVSAGPDKIFGTADDIFSFEID